MATNQKWGLSKDEINTIQTLLNHFSDVETAILYGSRAKGNNRPSSDIDLTLKGTISLQTLNQISNALDDLLLPVKFDLSIYSHIDNAALIDHIQRIGKIFYQKNEFK